MVIATSAMRNMWPFAFVVHGRMSVRVSVIIPALNEAASIGRVLDAIPRALVSEILVVDNGSTDDTARVAAQHGARVLSELERGYGAACLRGLDAVSGPDTVAFLDGDFSDHPEELPLLLAPIQSGIADLVIGSRTLKPEARAALLPQARFGNWLACGLMRIFFGARHTDLGPFRAITAPALARLAMRDRDFGWTIEMQVKAARAGLRVTEVPVSYRKRIGQSKISGTVWGSARAGVKILTVIFRHATRGLLERLRLTPPTTWPASTTLRAPPAERADSTPTRPE
jgi:glycosyltransferase involved in cell wall biosynthesis